MANNWTYLKKDPTGKPIPDTFPKHTRYCLLCVRVEERHIYGLEEYDEVIRSVYSNGRWDLTEISHRPVRGTSYGITSILPYAWMERPEPPKSYILDGKNMADMAAFIEPKCQECGRLYVDFIGDVVLPNDQWAAISGRDDGGGLLCHDCIVRLGRQKLTWATVALLRFE